MKQNWEKRFDKKFIDYIDHEFVISNNKPITIGIEQLKAFIKQEIKRVRKDEIEFLKRLKLEFDVVICDCGEEWKDTDGADLVNERLREIRKELK